MGEEDSTDHDNDGRTGDRRPKAAREGPFSSSFTYFFPCVRGLSPRTPEPWRPLQPPVPPLHLPLNVMTNRQCAVVGCCTPAKGFSTLCGPHRNNKTRHGHPEQLAVNVYHLRPYLKLVTARRAANADNPAWSMLERRWEVVVREAVAVMARAESGQPFVKWQLQAAHLVHKLAGSVDASTIANTALAMFMLRVSEPGRFKSDLGFTHQLVRRVLGLSSTNVGSYWNQKTGRVHNVYRDPPPRAVALIAERLVQAFGVTGVQLAEIELRKEDRKAAAERKLAEAVEALV